MQQEYGVGVPCYCFSCSPSLLLYLQLSPIHSKSSDCGIPTVDIIFFMLWGRAIVLA
jgi:hypothetical protein